jgi:hypothetical protein
MEEGTCLTPINRRVSLARTCTAQIFFALSDQQLRIIAPVFRP